MSNNLNYVNANDSISKLTNIKEELTKQKKEMANILEHYSQNSSISVDQSKEQLKELLNKIDPICNKIDNTISSINSSVTSVNNSIKKQKEQEAKDATVSTVGAGGTGNTVDMEY